MRSCKAHAVNALLGAWIGFMCANGDMIQCAIICTRTMVSTLLYSAANGLIFLIHHENNASF